MKKRITHWLMLVASAIGVTTSAFADTIACVADPVTGVYCGTGYKISVSVSKPATGATVELSETGGDGTWVAADSFAGYKDACTDKPMYYKVTATGYADTTGSANVTVTPKALTEDYVWGVYPADDYVYDGTEKKPDVACGDGEPSIITEDDFTVSYQDNVNAGTAKVIFTGKNNYAGTVEEEFEIRKAKGWIGGEEPGTGVVPPGGISKYDTTAMYDGQWHTIDTNALKTVSKEGFTLSFEYALTKEGPYAIEPILFKDVTVTSIWYKICLNNSNYEDYTHQAKVTVTNRPVTVTSKDISKPFDGTPLKVTVADMNVAMGGGLIETALPAGESFVYGDFGERTKVGTSPASFSVSAGLNTKLDNYDIHCVTGTITIIEARAVTVTVTGHTSSATYDGSKKSVSGYDIVSISDPLYKSTDFKFTGIASTNGTDAGTYPMGLKPSDFVNTNGNFSSVTFNVTDGSLVIVQAANEWTTTPAIEGWTYGETAKTPVGAAKFGTVAFAYDPTPVGDAGDYTMTASVAGTANYTGLSKDIAFTIAKKTIPGDGDEPGGGEVPPGGLSKYDVTVMYDGEEHTIDTNALVQAFKTAIDGDFEVRYCAGGPTSVSAADATERVPPAWKDVVATSLWYRVTSPNYNDYTHQAKVTITPRDIANATIAPIAAVEYAGVPVTPVPTVTDGNPSIITTSDYTVSYDNNNAPGTAALTLTGKGNYTGTKSANFTITSPTPKYATLTGFIAWKLNLGSGCYTAQLKLSCTNGFECGISNLRYLFADRMNGSKTTASLWDSSSRAARPTTSWHDVTYRSVLLDASKISRQGASVIYGVKDVSQSKGVISSDECTIELYVPSLAVPSSYEGLVVWTSGGSDHALKISASGGATPVPEPVSAAAPAQPIRATVVPVAIPTATTDELGLRNVFTSTDKTDKILADTVLSIWKGTYVMAYPEIDEDGVNNGWNTFSIKIGTRGRTIVAGILANGKSVSASAQMLVGDKWCKIAVSSTRKNDTFAFTLWPSRDGEVLEVEGVEGAVIDEVGNLTGESAFKLSADDLAIVLGTDAEIALDDVLPEDVPITLKGYRWVLPTVGSVRVVKKQLDYSRIKENPSALRLSFSKTTGRFTGSFKVYLWNGTKLKYVSATVKGIVVGGVGYGTAKVGKYGTMPISVEPVEAE